MRPPVPVPTLSRRAKLVLGAIAVLLVLFTVIGSLTNVYVDYLWFDETGYTEVFWTELQSRALLFAVAGVATGGLTALAVYLAYRFRPTFRPMSLEQQNLERYRQSLEPRRGLVLTAVGVVLGLFAGFTAQSNWETWLTFRNSTEFGQTDPQFGLDLSFFVFEYPFYRLVLGFGFAIVILALIGSLLTNYVFGGLRVQTPGQKLTSAARVQVSVLLGIFVALKAVAYWLDRYGLVYSERGDVFTGASYTDVNALLVPKVILVFVAAVCAIAFFANIVVRNFLLPAAALVLLLASSLVIGVAYPAIVQQFVVKPSANEREAPYIERAIEMTRQAYGLDDVEYIDYAQETTTDSEDEAVDPEVALAELRNDTETIPNARLLDPNVLADTFTARQQIRNWYGFPEKLDVDRYVVDGELRDYVVAVRELNSAGLSENQSTWINRHTVYTHGHGFVAAPANEVVGGSDGGEPSFTTGDLPVTGDIPVEQSRIYYGELIDDYSVVGAPEGTAPRESDLPGSDDRQLNNTYDGEGGVSAGSFFRQLTFAVYFRERNFLLSSAVNEESKVLYVRDPRQRVEKAAPFLEVDGDPYPAVIDGRVTWILDGYTTSDSYPYSEQMELGEAATDALTGTGTTALPNDTFNYIRNSVKATVDAYDGTVTLYEWDEQDPVLQTYMKAFPGTVEAKSEVSEELESHLRYPEDLFKVQRDILTRYHVDDPISFYEGSDRWQVPDDPTQDVEEAQPPYYILAQRPGDPEATFQLTSALNAFQRPNLSAFVSASSAPESYGDIQVLQLPGNTPFRGPGQVQNSFGANQEIRRDLTLFDSENSNAVLGNLLTLPIGDAGLLYVQPLYVESTGEGGFPLLQRVLVNFGGQIGYANTLAEALDQVFGEGAGEIATDSDGLPVTPPDEDEGEEAPTPAPAPEPAPAPGGGGQPGASPDMDEAVGDINAALEALRDAQRNGDFAGQGRALEQLDAAVEAYRAAQAAADGSGTGGD
ncbi:UPF0182 family protein [Candidatus Blastococcus massiliensis]|uniref:UPF0182 family membrane protein n=1 Tax=Candidatus Blastococcus massiliensis TaxID=1470358 RepID=UPI001E57951D|nr:UPF0182 family protein [Candidatus Blastococcus massiliensis]